MDTPTYEWRDDAPTDDVRRAVDGMVAQWNATLGLKGLSDDSVEYHEALILGVLADLSPRTLPATYAPPNAPVTESAVEAAWRLVEDGDLEYAAVDGGVVFRLANGRKDAESLLRDGYSDAEAVRTLGAMGHRPHAEKLWKATKLANAGKESNMAATTNEEKATEGSNGKQKKHRGRPRAAEAAKPASAAVATTWDFVLTNGKRAQLSLPSNMTKDDVEAVQEQLDLILKLASVQAAIAADKGEPAPAAVG